MEDCIGKLYVTEREITQIKKNDQGKTSLLIDTEHMLTLWNMSQVASETWHLVIFSLVK